MKKQWIALLILTAFMLFPGKAKAETLQEEVEVPIIMYHKVSKDLGQIGKYSITPDELEADFKFIRDNGYNTVTINDLVAYVQEGTALPENPIVLTFDDGHFSDYRYVYPLLEQYEIKAVLSIIGKVTDEYTADNRQDITYPHLTWDQLREMVDAGAVEVQNHGYDLHCERAGVMGARQRWGETNEDYADRLSQDLLELQTRAKEMLGAEPTTFTYPFGAKSEDSDKILQSIGFSASLTCQSGRNIISQGNTDCLFSMGRIIRPHGTSLEEIMD